MRSFSVPFRVIYRVFLSYHSVCGTLLADTGLPAVCLFKETAVEFAVCVTLKKANIFFPEYCKLNYVV